MRVLVIGGTAFIGRTTVERLVQRGHDVTILHRRPDHDLGAEVHNIQADRRDLPAGDEVYVAEINLDLLTAQAPTGTLRATALPRFPWVVRDVSILVEDTLSAGTVRGTICSAAPGTLIDIREFDRYQGKGIPDGKVSLSFRLTFQSPERTLTDEEVQAGMQHIIDALTRDLHATQR